MAEALRRRYPGDPASAKAARDDIAALLHRNGLEHLTPTAVLLADELVSNAVVHAAGPVSLDARCTGGSFRVEVEDSGGRPRVARDGDMSGRGLGIVDAIATSWGFGESALGGRITWFELVVADCPSSPSRPESGTDDAGT